MELRGRIAAIEVVAAQVLAFSLAKCSEAVAADLVADLSKFADENRGTLANVEYACARDCYKRITDSALLTAKPIRQELRNRESGWDGRN